jgi:chromosomal replication initiator protein
MTKDPTEAWNKILEIIKDNVNDQSYKTWFEPIKPLKLENNILTIQVPSLFFYEWLEEHYVSLLKKTLKHEI